MTKKDLVSEIKAQMSATGIMKQQIEEVLTHAFDLIWEAAHTETVKIAQFGQFRMVTRKARTGRNPRTGETITIPERQVLKFKASSK